MVKGRVYVVLIVCLVIVLGWWWSRNESTQKMEKKIKDENGCLVFEGDKWCESKKACINTNQECEEGVESISDEALGEKIKALLVDKYGESGESRIIKVTDRQVGYAKGLVQEDKSGGVWLAAIKNGEWQIVADGNGIVSCDKFAEFPDFPVEWVPNCVESETSNLRSR